VGNGEGRKSQMLWTHQIRINDAVERKYRQAAARAESYLSRDNRSVKQKYRQAAASWFRYQERSGAIPQGGSALLEVTAALLILALLSPALISLFNASKLYAAHAAYDLRVLHCVQSVLEEIKAVPESRRGVALGGGEHFIILEAEGIDCSGLMIALTSGAGEGQVRKITAFDAESKTASIEPAWATVPVQGSTKYVLLRDRSYRDHLQITACPTVNDTLSITVTYIDQRHTVPNVSLTADMPGW